MFFFSQEISRMQILVKRIVPEEQNFKDVFFQMVLGFWNWFSNLIKFKGLSDHISSVKEGITVQGTMWQQRCKKDHP